MGLDLDSGSAMAHAGDEARAALRRLEEVMPRWSAIRNAHERLLGLSRESGAYSPVRNIDAYWPQRRAIMGKVPPAPWPSNSMARLLWYVTTEGVELWLPTLTEEREAFEAGKPTPTMRPVIAPTLGPSRSPQRPVLNLPGAKGRTRVRVVTADAEQD